MANGKSNNNDENILRSIMDGNEQDETSTSCTDMKNSHDEEKSRKLNSIMEGNESEDTTPINSPVSANRRRNCNSSTLVESNELIESLSQELPVDHMVTVASKKEKDIKCEIVEEREMPAPGKASANLKRKRPSRPWRTVLDDEYHSYAALRKFQYTNHSLRLSASQIAAMTGFHPYTNLPRLLMGLVYQGPIGQALLRRDANLINVELISEEESLLRLAKKAGDNVEKAFKSSLDVSTGKKKVSSIQGASSLKNDVVSKARNSKRLSKGELKQLSDGARYNVNTGFGKEHEDVALDLYEELTGWEVRERNTKLKYWDFIREEDLQNWQGCDAKDWTKSVVPINAARPFIKAIEVEKSSGHDDVGICNREPIIIESDDDIILKCEKENKELSLECGTSESGGKCMKKSERKPFFSILGVADGVCDELFPLSAVGIKSSENAEDEWSLRTVVIECKHRMKKAFLPPPIYDQIQAIVYCFMYNTSHAEIVQVVRESKVEQTKGRSNASKGKSDEREHLEKKTTKITRSRISLDDPVMKHGENWVSTILPRLRKFVEAVYSIRSSNEKRYSMIKAAATAGLGGDSTEWWSILIGECPFLIDCDTAFQREQV